jgi:hypothetical protein
MTDSLSSPSAGVQDVEWVLPQQYLACRELVLIAPLADILDKPLESVFGYITVLRKPPGLSSFQLPADETPSLSAGAFSAYRYIALQNDQMGEGPLKEYFKGETLHHSVDA